MTRETKIGMAIATTFLSLVGLVVTSKMRRPDAPSEAIAQMPPAQPKAAAEESSAPPGAAQAPGNGVHAGQGSETPAGQPLEPGVGGTAKKKENESPRQPPSKLANGLPNAPAIPEPLTLQPAGGALGADVKRPFPPVPEGPAKSTGDLPGIEPNPLVVSPLPPSELKKLGAMPPVTDPLVAPAPIKVGGLSEPGAGGLPLPPPITLKDTLPKNPLSKDPLSKDPLSKDPLATDPFPKDPFPKDPLPAKSNGLADLPAVNGALGNSVSVPPVQVADPLKQKPDPNPIVPMPDPTQPKLDTKIGNPAVEKRGADPIPPPLTAGGAFPPVAPALKSESIGIIGNSGGDIHITPPVTPGSPGNGVPLLPTANSNLPKVTTYEEKTHVTQPGVTSFDELSKTLYGTPVYGQALLEYNRQHVMATAGVKQNSPLVQPNQQIYYPPYHMLEIQYPQLIQHAAAAPAAPAQAVKISAPTPLVGPGSVSGTNPPTADATVAYRVAQPQFIYDIARQQLGDGLLWTEILRLNPALHTDQPIPAGTELRLPKAR